MVAMSGGVDSSVAALLLQEAGYDCMGAMMRLFSPDELMITAPVEDPRDAKKIAALLGISFHVYDCAEAFRRHVIDYFIQTYQNGGMPNPCVVCNRTMKFGHLLELARTEGCERIATGHYARIERNEQGRYLLRVATDSSKDQSYVLWQLTQDQLAHTLFPLGELKKSEIRELAASNGFLNAERRDSQDICFIPDGDYVGFIERNSDLQPSVGNFVDCNGNILGQHLGHLRYTVGQRKGLGIAFGVPTYVCAKDAASNTVTLGSNEDLFRRELTAHSINLISCERLEAPTRVLAKVRYKAAPAPAVVEQLDDDRIVVRFDEPQRAICPGQSVVLYDGEYVLGGGVID
jgi:tRNA-specific 2-thiouridylase